MRTPGTGFKAVSVNSLVSLGDTIAALPPNSATRSSKPSTSVSPIWPDNEAPEIVPALVPLFETRSPIETGSA
ncbi:hypothetical protein, partial [Mesorhizobium sp. M1E.F.Ca.ET.041.01.1.1]|uniref:hypothetical protein n=1 Tax=Mesorhizobium sp. M1E.F.Ca.ET.041.01.1.1 TaxID=2496759 RepID=UPI001AED0BE7